MKKDEIHGKKKIGKILRITGILSLLTMILCGIFCMLNLQRLNVLPENDAALIKLVLMLLVLLLALMQFHRGTLTSAIVLAIMLSVGLGGGAYYLSVSVKTLKEITRTTISKAVVGLYVQKTDEAENLDDLRGAVIGILKTLDRSNTDAALAEFLDGEENLGTFVEYEGVMELAEDFLAGKIRGILVNSAYLSLLDENEDMTDFESEIRQIWSYEVTRTLEIETMPQTAETDTEVDAEITEEEEQLITSSPFIVYLSGNDTNGKLNSVGRSDVNILMAVNPEKREILLVNTPRDYYVTLAGIGEKDKLTHAGIYGVDTSMKTLAALYEVNVPYYVRLNFTGFMDMIDALGGITVVSDVEFTVADWHYVIGENQLSGIEALAFARERYSFADGDRQRGRNQVAVIKGIIKKACSPAILTGYTELMEAASEAVETNMSKEEITELVKMQLEEGGTWTVNSVSADGTGETGPCYSTPGYNTYRMIPDETTVEKVKEELRKLGF